MDDLPRREETLSWEPETAALTDAIVTARDNRLIEEIHEQFNRPREAKRIAVVYGAAHMRAVVRALADSRGYHAKEAVWLTVFGPTTAMSA
jgi:tartrate dehydratase beta subunit/fumarate hydratase class I family protein